MMQLIQSGYILSQVGGAFVVHYPHLDSPARAKWNQAPDVLVVEQPPTKNKKKTNIIPQQQIRRPKKSDGNLHLATYKRGQVDQLFVAFRKWLETTTTNGSGPRLKLCHKAQDDDSKLWIDHDFPTITTTKDSTVVDTENTNPKKQEGSSSKQQQQQRKKEQRQEAIEKDNTRLEEEAAAAAAAAAVQVKEVQPHDSNGDGQDKDETDEMEGSSWKESDEEVEDAMVEDVDDDEEPVIESEDDEA